MWYMVEVYLWMFNACHSSFSFHLQSFLSFILYIKLLLTHIHSFILSIQPILSITLLNSLPLYLYLPQKLFLLRNSRKRSMSASNAWSMLLHNMLYTSFNTIANTFSSLLTEFHFWSENSWLFYCVIQLLMNFVFF